MKHLRKRLTYANVISSLALFLVIAGGTAFAASQLGKNSVGSKQLKKNAVTAAKIKKNAVTKAKIKNGSVNGAKIADGSVTGAEINLGSTPFGRVVAKLRNAGPAPFGVAAGVPIGTYAQPAGETDMYIAGLTVNFDPACGAPRKAAAYLSRNPQSPAAPNEGDSLAIGVVIDKTGASPSAKMEFSDFPVTGGSATTSFEPTTTENQAFYVHLLSVECASGPDAATASNIGVNVIGVR